MKRFFLILAIAVGVSGCSGKAVLTSAEETESGYVFEGFSAPIYYFAPKPVNEGNNASVAVISIHGYGGGIYRSNPYNALCEELGDSCYVIAPLFPTPKNMKKFHLEEDGRALWNRSWSDIAVPGNPDDDWRGGGDAEGTAISSYDVIDRILGYLSDRKLYPNMERIVLSGFSAGGQFVDRYAAVGKARTRRGITLDFVSMSPSTNLYLKKDAVWHYGLASRPRYSRKLPERVICRNLERRRVLHACGTLDVGQGSLDVFPEAVKQGENRLDRFHNYEEYVSLFPAWHRSTRFYTIDNIAHESAKAYRDSVIVRYIKTGEFIGD